MSVVIKNKIIQTIFELFKYNEFIKKEDLEIIEKRLKSEPEIENEIFIFQLFSKKYSKNLSSIKETCFTNGFFTKEEYIKLENDLSKYIGEGEFEEEENLSISEEKKPVIEKRVEKKNISEKISNTKVFTENEIKKMIDNWENLYKAIPGDKVPKTDNQLYVDVQLKRFIDSGWSDFIVETQKLNGMIYNMIKFKIAWIHETQDKTELAYTTDESDKNLNPFFDTVRKYLWSSLWSINSDAKHIVQDTSFSLSYRGKTRDFRMSSLPTRCVWIPYPRYCIRLTSEGDNIDFNKIELLPFMKKFYLNIIHNKQPWMTAITWPTGSWKTTTIYWILNEIDKEKFSILAVEKPIESQVHWINQTQEDAYERDDKKERYTNKDFMKAVLRQAWDVIFVWEMRDAEETQQWVKTWLVGNKLITTFHTNSSVDTILRMKEEGVTNNAIWNWVKNITAQRLVQKVCPKCSIVHREESKFMKKIFKLFNRSKIFFLSEMRTMLNHLSIEDLSNIDMLEIHITDNLNFLSKKDVENMIELIEENSRKFTSIKLKAKKIDFLLELYKDFPNPTLRKWINNEIDKWWIKEANPKWCSKCTEWYLLDRIMIVEWLSIDKSIKRFIQDPEAKLIDLEKFILNKWFIDMRMYWYILVMQGITTLEKIDEVTEE